MSKHALVALKALPLLLALTLTACSPMMGTGVRASSPQSLARTCEVWPFVSWSEADTRETIADAKANNAAKKAFCQ